MEKPPRWVLYLCAMPVCIAVMVFVIWCLRHGYLSIYSRNRQEEKLIIYGLAAPFCAVLYAIIAFFMRKDKRQ